jgi:site-specific DNA-methyltransferase (adenine-specific)
MKGDNMESLKKLPDNSIDSIVTDPPYGLSFMGKKWDYDVPGVEFWKEVYRVLKPGGHVLSFGGTRTYHRMVVNIEDAGFEIRDQVMWLYGSGFPKSHNIGKAVDKIEGNDREIIMKNPYADGSIRKATGNVGGDDNVEFLGSYELENGLRKDTKGNSKYEGWGTALKPANEPICVARKPLSEKTIAENVIKWGTGGINIDGCRVGSEGGTMKGGDIKPNIEPSSINIGIGNVISIDAGRFPANIILDETAAELLDEQSGVSKSRTKYPEQGLDNLPMNHYEETKIKHIAGKEQTKEGFTDKGGASRFFYVAKVSKKERNLGLDGFEEKEEKIHSGFNSRDENGNKLRADGSIIPPLVSKNTHPTLKPINLMTYLCRLVTPEGGIVLDPFMGSGSTGISALLEGFRFVGMEMDEDYFKIAEARINSYEQYRDLLKKK